MEYSKELIKGKLAAIADANYESNASYFKDKAQFKTAIESCYQLIANGTCREWNALNGENCHLASIAQGMDFTNLFYGIEHTHIHSSDFKRLLGSFRMQGKKARVPYAAILEVLESNGIIAIDGSYSSGKDKDGNKVGGAYTKSYRLDFRFMADVIRWHFDHARQNEPFNIYSCFHAYYPDKLLKAKIEEAKALYEKLAKIEIEGLRLRLPTGWQSRISRFGYLTFDEKLEIDNLISGMKSFERHKQGAYTGGRFYDWFTACSSAFRKYLYKDSKNYRELIDCHSGIFWMFALHGYAKGQIGKDECRRMIEHCFHGSFYSDVSGQDKTKALKQTFMKVLNMSKRQMNYMENILNDALFIKIHDKLSRAYPQWSAFLDGLKKKKHGKIGRYNHFSTIKIERRIMDELKHRLEVMGYTDLRRVHDALYGLESVPDIEKILLDVVLEYFDLITFKISDPIAYRKAC